MYQKRKIKSNHGSVVASERQPYNHVIPHSGDNNACAVLHDRPVPKKTVPSRLQRARYAHPKF